MFQFCTRNGVLYDGAGAEVATGYSGHEKGYNNPELERVHNVGPIPRGEYSIAGPPFTSPHIGAYVLRLVPKAGTDTFGRGAFECHGEHMVGPPGLASHGCIILPLHIRELVWKSGDHDLVVIGSPPTQFNAA